MKYNIMINQLGVVKNNLVKTTDLVDWAIIEYLTWAFWNEKAKRIVIDNEEYVWIHYDTMLKDMPLLKIKSKGALSDRIKSLELNNLIKTAIKDSIIYIRLTTLASSVATNGVRQNEHPRSLKRTHNNTINNNTNNNINITDKSVIISSKKQKFLNKQKTALEIINFWNSLMPVKFDLTPSGYLVKHDLYAITSWANRVKDRKVEIMLGIELFNKAYGVGELSFLKQPIDFKTYIFNEKLGLCNKFEFPKLTESQWIDLSLICPKYEQRKEKLYQKYIGMNYDSEEAKRYSISQTSVVNDNMIKTIEALQPIKNKYEYWINKFGWEYFIKKLVELRKELKNENRNNK